MPSFNDGESEAQRRNMISPESHAELVVEPRLEPLSSDLRSKALCTTPDYDCSRTRAYMWKQGRRTVKEKKKLLASSVHTL